MRAQPPVRAAHAAASGVPREPEAQAALASRRAFAMTPRRARGWSRRSAMQRVRFGGGRRGQRGSIMMIAAIALGLAIVALGAVDVGNVYFVRRSLQRTADMSAMAAVQVISTPSGCGGAQNAAQLNAQANGFTADGSNYTISTTCGRWDTSSKTYFGNNGNPLNAVQVQLTQQVPMFFLAGPSISVSASATALASNIDAFSLGTGIASLNTQQSALLNAILGGLLKSNISLSVGDTQSLASAHIKLDDLRVALGAASMQGLLKTSVTYQQLVAAMVSALQAGGDTVNATILQALEVDVPGGQNIAIGDNGTSAPGLLALGLANANSAASATVNALDAVMVAAQIAQSNPDGSAGSVINLTTGITGVAGLSLQVIHPPVLAVGEAGTATANGVTDYRTQARTAALQLGVKLLPVGLPTLTVGVPGLAAISISALSTPIALQLAVGAGTASLVSIDCESTKAATNATILAKPSIVNACLGSDSSCSTPIGIASISTEVLGITKKVATVQLDNTQTLSLGPASGTQLVFNGASGSFDSYQTVNSNALGSDASVLTTQVLNALPNLLKVKVFDDRVDLSGAIAPILSAVGDALKPLLKPVFSLLDTVLLPALQLLGVQLGTATVHNMSLTCGVPQLVQ
ncbi:pilus assembly protein TadG-related protein [Paraburkholderia sp. MMS20-SJTR3]|uniref:Pilus assembly protein TadG-related protein n=1 Tax=Paraburkholderia sejongensis TaxID=2886946 RepID=A0ABS8JMR7_9BURK|nr:TadG family pilus assembly protein [Paraburkholderia sp. MMS20-SJTR3]MCC8391176.1 pilus assembly protein TadG-related protein [Paraburkholderia sp. MMS20-SJTR3]